ncbi:hypothetical protein NEOKW01_1348 [Nematocida sp. AWRm80]|nr:hypothetical protein NEOKW01_1348 [Nematocida sp. AWRm80]
MNETEKQSNNIETQPVETTQPHAKTPVPSTPVDDSSSDDSTNTKKPEVFESLITFNNYSRKTSKSISIIKNASFSLPKGKLIALIGLSGDGKSTLMDSIAGLCDPSHKTYGEIQVRKKGVMVTRDSINWHKKVNYIKQHASSYENIPMYTLLMSIARCYGKEKKDVDGLLSIFRITRSKKTKFKNLSGGEQKRTTTIAGMLASKELNIWDEPLTGLDSELAMVTLTTMKHLKRTNLVSVHQVSDDLMKVFDWVIILHSGTAIYSGEPAKLVPYFEEKGLKFPKDVFYINYIMRMSAGNTHNTLDQKNLGEFNNIADKILEKEEGQRNAGNKYLIPNLKIRFRRVLQILSRSFYFDRKFKGSGIIAELFVYAFVICIVFIDVKISLKSLKEFNNGQTGLPVLDAISGLPEGIITFEKMSSQEIVKGIGMKSTNIKALGASIDTIASRLKKCLAYMLNLSWIIVVGFVLGGFTMFALFVALSGTSNLTNPKFYALCKTNIEEGQFTVADFLLAQLIEVVYRKMIPPFILQCFVLFVFRLNFYSDDTSKVLGISSFTIITGMLVTSFLIGLYSYVLLLAPISIKLHGLISLIFVGLFCFFAFTLYSPPPYEEELHNLLIYSRGQSDIDARVNMLKDMAGNSIKYKLAKYANAVYKFIVSKMPFLFSYELISKIAIKTDNAPVDMVSFLRSASGNLDAKDTDSFFEFFKRFHPAHEICYPESKITEVSILNLILTVSKYFFIPICLLLLCLLYSYRCLQPRIR